MQQNPNPQPDDAARQRTKSKRPRPYTIEARTRKWLYNTKSDDRRWGEWYRYGSYRTVAERDDALEHHQRVNHRHDWIEFRAGADLV